MADASYMPKVYHKREGDELIIADGGELSVEDGGAMTIESAGDLSVESGGTLTVESGAEVTIESGGTIDVESGGGIDIESGGDIGLESGGKIIVASGGEIEGLSGGLMDAQSGFKFFLADTTDYVYAQTLGAYMRGRVNIAFIGQSQGAGAPASGVLSAAGGSSPPVLPSFHGYIFFSIGGISANSASVRLCSAHKGEDLLITMLGSMSTALILVLASNSGITGVSLEGGMGVGVSVGASHVALSCFTIAASATSNPWIRLVCFTEGCWSVVEHSNVGIVEYSAA